MALAVATAMSLPGWLAPGSEPHRALSTPPSSSQRVIHVDVGATGRNDAGKAARGRLALAGRPSALAGRIVATHPSSPGPRSTPRLSVSSQPVSARTRPPRKPRPSAPNPAPRPAPVSTPAPQSGSGVAAPPPTSVPTRELASAAPAPAAAPPPAPPAENTSAKAQRREGQTDQPGASDPGSSGCGGDHGSSRGDRRDDDHQGQDYDGNRRSGDHGGRGRDE